MMNLKFTETSFNVSEQILPANTISPSQELSDEELRRVYGGQGMSMDMGMGHGMGNMTMKGSSSGGKKGYSLRVHLYGSNYWNHWKRTSYSGHGGDEDED